MSVNLPMSLTGFQPCVLPHIVFRSKGNGEELGNKPNVLDEKKDRGLKDQRPEPSTSGTMAEKVL